jgi:hypothetical protein
MKASLILAAGVLALAAPAASAQGACDDVARYFAKPPQLGEWAELQLDMKKDQGKRPMVMRFGFVDKEERGGRPMYRLQMTMAGKDGKRQIMQMLTPWGPNAWKEDHDTEMVMKMGDQPAVVMPFKAGKGQPGMSDLRKDCAKVTFLGEESVTVPAGTYETRHYSGPDGDSWVATGVPALRLVKMVTKNGDTMVLTATGTGETNQITEKPMDMKAMMGGGAMKRMMEVQPEQEEAK